MFSTFCCIFKLPCLKISDEQKLSKKLPLCCADKAAILDTENLRLKKGITRLVKVKHLPVIRGQSKFYKDSIKFKVELCIPTIISFYNRHLMPIYTICLNYQ